MRRPRAAAGCRTVIGPADAGLIAIEGVRIREARHLSEALGWASDQRERRSAGGVRRSSSGPLTGEE